jgi:hypothetical protein
MISAPNDVITKPATAGGIAMASPDLGDRPAPFMSPWVEYLVLVILLGLFLFRGFVPAWRSLNTDFRNYYVAARLYREGESLLRVYDFTWFQRQKDHAGMEPCLVGFVPDTPLSALPIVPLAELPPLTAKRAWLVINAIVLGLSAVGLMQMTQLGWRRVLIVTFLAIEPLAKGFLFGQMHLLVVALLIAAVWLARRERPFAAGIAVALAAGLKIYPAIFLLFFLRKKQWRIFAGTAAGLLALAGLSIYLFGWDVHRVYLSQILPIVGRGENIDPYSPGWNSLTALLHRLFIAEPDLNPHPLLAAPALYALAQPLLEVLIFLPALWLLTPGPADRDHENLEWAAFAAMLMAISSGPLSYHLCFLILPAALALNALSQAGRGRQAALVIALYTAICLPWNAWPFANADGWHAFLASPRLYPLVALPSFLCWILWARPEVRVRLRTHHRESLAFACLFLLLAFTGSAQTFLHLRNLFGNYPVRLFVRSGALLQGEPAVGAQGLYITSMAARGTGFETERWSTGRLEFLPPAEDEFHPTTAPRLADVWVELAGPVSRIARFPASAGGSDANFAIEVKNGEQPSISPDGTWLAFIRERRGRGGLWIKSLTNGATARAGEQRMLVDDSYDVWEAAFGPGDQHIIFAAAKTGQPELYSLDLAAMRVAAIPMNGPARYPAISPDGQWLAYSRCEHGTWQLYVSSREGATTRRLTQGDCNSISPAWEADSKSLIYATDCGRGLGMTALARAEIFPLPSD